MERTQITRSTDGDWNLQPIFSCLDGYQQQETKLATASPDWSKLPNDSKATVTMLTATNLDEPASNTRSKTSQQQQTTKDIRHSNTPSIMKPATSDLITVKITQDITSKSLTANRHKALHQMQRMDQFCKHI